MGDMLLVVSASGVFAQSIGECVDEAMAEKYLVTAIPHPTDEARYDRVVRLSQEKIDYDRLGLYGKYAVSYFFDLLSACYLNLYSS